MEMGAVKEGCVFEDVCDFRNLMQCARECANSVRWKSSVQVYEANILQWVASTRRQLLQETYKSRGFNEFAICERGKTRHIQAVHISERVVQKSLVRHALTPCLVPCLIYDNSATLKGKGTDFAIKRLREHLRRHYQKHGREGGVLTLDIKSYFDSIDHETLKAMLRKRIADKWVLRLTEYFIDRFKGGKGLGLGSEISQICAVFYLNDVDHYIKERLHIKGYGRYMDDMYLIHEDTDYLKTCEKDIAEKIKEYGLKLNSKRTHITKLKSGSFTFLKKRFFVAESGKIVMRLVRKNITRRRRTMKRQAHMLHEKRIEIDSVRNSYASWRGYARKCDSYRTIQNQDKLFTELFKQGGNDESRNAKSNCRSKKADV